MSCDISPIASELEVLSSLRESTLERVEGHRPFEGPSVFNRTVRPVTDKGTVSLVCKPSAEPVYVNGDTEDLGVLEIRQGAADLWLPESQKITKEQVRLVVTDVKAVVLDVTLMNGAREDGHVRYLQAVAIGTGEGWLCFDKGPWFSEFVTATRANSFERLTIGEGDWGREDPYSAAVSKSVIDL